MRPKNHELGVAVAWQSAEIDAVTILARCADDLGFHYFWAPEAWGLEAFSTVAHILDCTKKIKVGTGIVNIYSRSAALIGMGCATLNQIAPERFLLGLGTSGRGLVEAFHGIKYERPLERTREYVNVIRKVASGEKVDYAGEILELSRFRLFTKETSSLGIYLGAIGAKNLRLAGEISDGAIVVMYPFSKLHYAEKLVMENGAKNSGKKKKLFAYFPTAIKGSTTDPEEFKSRTEEIRKNIAFYITSMGKYYSANLWKLGFEEDVSRIIAGYSKEGSAGVSKFVSDQLLEELSLIGTRDAILEKIAKLDSDTVPVLVFPARSSEDVQSSLKALEIISSL